MAITPDTKTALTKRSRGRPSREFSNATREKLIEAAILQFAAKDFSDVSLKGIATQVGVSDAAIYNHFSSKDDLFLQTICTIIDRYITLYGEAVRGKTSWKAQMNAIFAAIEDDIGGATRLPRIAAIAESVASRDRARFAPIYAGLARFKTIFVDIVHNGQKSGDIPSDSDPDVLAGTLMSIITAGISASMIGDRSEANLRAVLQSYRTLLALDQE